MKPIHIQKFYDSLFKNGLGGNTVLHYHASIRKALEDAMKLDVIPSNPADKIQRPKKELRHIRFHDLRHSCASLLLARGIPMKAIQEWLGHSTYSTTANLYTHLESNTTNISANVLASAINFA